MARQFLSLWVSIVSGRESTGYISDFVRMITLIFLSMNDVPTGFSDVSWRRFQNRMGNSRREG